MFRTNFLLEPNTSHQPQHAVGRNLGQCHFDALPYALSSDINGSKYVSQLWENLNHIAKKVSIGINDSKWYNLKVEQNARRFGDKDIWEISLYCNNGFIINNDNFPSAELILNKTKTFINFKFH